MENNIFLDILPPKQKKLFLKLKTQDWISIFYLAGGTALALQIGHRKSIDFDFFSPVEFDIQLTKNRLIKLGDFKLFSESEATLHGELDSIQISFFNIPFPLIKPPQIDANIRIASKADIAAMKLAAIANRGTKKDYIDIYYLLKEFSLKEMFEFYVKKYGYNKENIYCSLKGLMFFQDAEEQDMPKTTKRVLWRELKKKILSEHDAYIRIYKGHLEE